MKFVLSLLALAAVVAAHEAGAPQPIALQGEQTVWSISESILGALMHALDDPKHQVTVVVGALVFGLVLLKDGQFSFTWMVIAAASIFAMLLSDNEVTLLGEGYQHSLRYFIAVEVGLATAYTTWKGIEGVQLGLAALIGMFVANKSKSILLFAQVDTDSINYHWMLLGWYSLFALIFMVFLRLKQKGRLMWVLVAPLLGGALTSSALLWIATYVSLHFGNPGELGTWLEFLTMLTNADSDDVGVFAHTASPFVIGVFGKYCADRVIGQSVWFVLFIIGFVHQFNHWVEWVREENAPPLQWVIASKF